MSSNKGWAVVTNGGDLLVRTVSDTRRAAIINYLVTEHRVLITIFDSDENIENFWRHYGEYAECREVNIQTIPRNVSLAIG